MDECSRIVVIPDEDVYLMRRYIEVNLEPYRVPDTISAVNINPTSASVRMKRVQGHASFYA